MRAPRVPEPGPLRLGAATQAFSTDLARSEDGRRVAETDRTFEWWYFDTILQDGSTCVLTYLNKPPFSPGPQLPVVLLNISHPGNPKAVNIAVPAPAASYAAATEYCEVRFGEFGQQRIRGDLHQYVVHAESSSDGYPVVVDMRLTGIVPAFRLGPVKSPEACAEQWLGEQVVIPAGSCEGTITHGGKTANVRGTCYHDHQWGGNPDLPPGPKVSSWYWGRAQVGDHAVVFAQVLTRPAPGEPEAPAAVMLLLSRRDGAAITYSDDVSALTVTRRQDGATNPSLDVEWTDALEQRVQLRYESGDCIADLEGECQYRRYLSSLTLTSTFNGETFRGGPTKMIWEENIFR